MGKVITKDADGFERIVFGEILIPDQPNVYGDYHSRESVREFAYAFAKHGFGLNVEHDNPDILPDGRVTVVESFVARSGDPDFIVGSWVLGVWIHDDEIWNAVLDGKINGFSYEAMVRFFELDLLVPEQTTQYGRTKPDFMDGHDHGFFVLLDDAGRVVGGGTTESQGHRHFIEHHTFTEKADDHVHVYQLNEG